MCSANATLDPPRALRSARTDLRPGGKRRDAPPHVRHLRRPVARRRMGRQRWDGAAVRGPLRGVLARHDCRRVPARVRAPGAAPRARLVGALDARAGGARRRGAVPGAARIPKPRHRHRGPGRVHPGVCPQRRHVPGAGRPALRARDERDVVPVVARPGRLPARVAAHRRPVPVGRRDQRALRVVREPQPLPPVPEVAAQRPRVLARPPLRRRRRVDDDQLRRRQAVRRAALRAPAARAAPPLPHAGHAHRGEHRAPRAPALAHVPAAHGGRRRGHPPRGRWGRPTPWIRSVAWFQRSSRGQVQIEGSGRLDWDVQTDPAGAALLRGIIRDGLR
jgi:hypothetical protein